jgi:Electron transfer DM13
MRGSALKEESHSPQHRRGRISGLMKSHPRMTGGIVAGAAVLAILGFLWFRPDKLFVNTTVNEALPSLSTDHSPASDATVETQILSAGPFRSLEHQTRGVASVVRLSDGRRIVRLESFSTSNGPDVVVILSDASASSEAGSFDDGRFVSLGALKGNAGNQNYLIPTGVDLSKYRSVVVWCRRFNVAFGAAPLEPKG